MPHPCQIAGWLAAVLLLTAMSAGCSGPPAETAQAKSDLVSIVLQYHQYVSDQQAPPANIDELAAFEDPFDSLPGNQASSSRCKTALRSDNYLVIWSYNVSEDLTRNGTVILAYHRDVPMQGGYVAFADGVVKLLTKEQFAATAKAEPTTESQPE